MNPLPILITLFVILPFIELVLLFKIGAAIGLLETLVIIIATGVAGAGLARHQGFYTIAKIRLRVNRGEIPTDEILNGFFILCASLLLVTPGFITDIVGFSLLVPILRKQIQKAASKLIKEHFVVSSGVGQQQYTYYRQQNFSQKDDDVIDVEGKEIKEDSEESEENK